jgi:hypothetical protein
VLSAIAAPAISLRGAGMFRQTFDVSEKVLGCDIELHNGKRVRLNQHDTTKKLFRQTSTGKKFDTNQMITNLLVKSGTRKQDLITAAAATEAFEKGVCVGKPDLRLAFTPGAFSLIRGSKSEDIKQIVFDVEITVRPRKQS